MGLRSDPIPERKQQIIELYEQGREYYLKRKLALALDKFEAVLAIDSEDKAALLHRQRCGRWINTPLPANWDGIETLTEK